MNNPKFPELEILRYACVAFDMKIIAIRDLEDDDAHMHLQQLGIQLSDERRLWATKEVTQYLEGYTQASYNNTLKRLTFRHKYRYIDEDSTMMFLKSSKISQSWSRLLWAQSRDQVL